MFADSSTEREDVNKIIRKTNLNNDDVKKELFLLLDKCYTYNESCGRSIKYEDKSISEKNHDSYSACYFSSHILLF